MSYCSWDKKCNLYLYKSCNDEYVFHLADVGGKHVCETTKDLGEALVKLKELHAIRSHHIPDSAVERMEAEFKTSLSSVKGA